MSFFRKLGGKKEPKAPTTAEAIQKLRETEDLLIKKHDYLENKIEAEIEIARKNASKNKTAAIQALKRKKRYAKQLQQIGGTLSTIEMQREALEGSHMNTSVFTSMKNAADALNKTHKNMNVDQVHDMMDDISEQHDVAKEISEAISNPVAFETDIDEDELERELEDLEQESLENDLLRVGPEPTASLPDVPISVPLKVKAQTKKVKDDDDLKELEAWAS